MTVAYASDGSTNPAAGVRGGGAAARALQIKRAVNGVEEQLPACTQVRLRAGEIMVSITQPGGGYGPPFECEPERVREDAAEGWITRERAEHTYGVVIDDDGNVDLQATRTLRSS